MGGMTDRTAPIAIGLSLPTWPRADRTYATWPEMRSLAREAEAMGVDTLWVPDHLQRDLASGERIGFWECWTIVTALAEATTSMGIGPYVACTGFRNPALLAKMAATLDEVSGGRLVLGLGSGVPERDTSWRAFGFEAARPVARYAEAVEVVVRDAPRARRDLRGRVLPDRRRADHPARDGPRAAPGRRCGWRGWATGPPGGGGLRGRDQREPAALRAGRHGPRGRRRGARL